MFLADEWLHAKPWDPLLAGAVLLTLAGIPVAARLLIAAQRRREKSKLGGEDDDAESTTRTDDPGQFS